MDVTEKHLAVGCRGHFSYFDLYKKNFLAENKLFYVFKPIERDELSEVLYKIQQVKFIDEASELFLRIN